MADPTPAWLLITERLGIPAVIVLALGWALYRAIPPLATFLVNLSTILQQGITENRANTDKILSKIEIEHTATRSHVSDAVRSLQCPPSDPDSYPKPPSRRPMGSSSPTPKSGSLAPVRVEQINRGRP